MNAGLSRNQDTVWFEEEDDKTPEAFFDHFGIMESEEGHRRYSRALSVCSLSKHDRVLLSSKFNTWKQSEGVAFWERRRTRALGKKVMWKTTGKVLEGSEPFVDTVLAEIVEAQTSELSSKRVRTPSNDSESEHMVSSSPVATPYLFRQDSPAPSSVEEDEPPSYSDDTNPTLSRAHYKVLNQPVAWTVGTIDVVEKFRDFQRQNLHDFSLARDGIADLRHGSKFRTFLEPPLAAAAGKIEPTLVTIYEKWPTLEGVLNRVFAKNHYDDVSRAVRDEDMHDPVVGQNYFIFHDDIPTTLNEREGFIDFTWAFIRGGMTLARVETRSLEVLIAGVQERKNQDKDPWSEAKQVGHFADGAAFHGSSQLYLSEASAIHNVKNDKRVRDDFKLARAMRDSWSSQVRTTCRERVPPRGMAVFGSLSFKEETKICRLDFHGVFRLIEFGAFLIPLKKREFGFKAKAAMISCLELALRVQEELDARSLNTSVLSYEERIKLEEAASAIATTTPTPSKSRTKRRWSADHEE
ncbi:hypothetical protein BGZ94_001674 [Podila epigama]|nr:hypothetical protein BGZ94_001674 [Podila epigama]